MSIHPNQPLLEQRSSAVPPAVPTKPRRLLSLDAYRGMIMVMLAASGFGVARLAGLPEDAPVWQLLDYDTWQAFAFSFHHPQWNSQCDLWGLPVGVSFWDLIQPAFMFMVGVAMPFSFARRSASGHSSRRQLAHAIWRGLVLVLMGVFLQSKGGSQTNWIFTNVLSQIGLGYVFLYLLAPLQWWVKGSAFVLILLCYWFFFFPYTAPKSIDRQAVSATEETVYEGRFEPWSKNLNAGSQADVWLLNLFPRPEGKPHIANSGGYVTLNFIPSIATMLLGLFCGQLLLSQRNGWLKLLLLLAAGAVCMALGLAAGQWACPIVKRIWTPSWVLFSGAWVIWMLAAFYLLFDLLRLRWLAFPLVVVGMNSIVMYMLGQLLRGWTTKMVDLHLGKQIEWLVEWLLGPGAMADDMFGRLLTPTITFLVFWLIVYWMYRQKIFVRV